MNKWHTDERITGWLQILQIAVVEITGEKSAPILMPNAPLKSSTLTELHTRLERMMGASACRGVEIRIGQAAFHIFLSRMAEDFGFFLPEIKFLPVKRKIMAGLQLLAEEYLRLTGERMSVLETEDAYEVTIPPAVKEIPSIYTGCPLLIGFLKEYVIWAGGGKFYQILEKSCCVDGNRTCVFHIRKVPLD
ncbi:MAG: hypothetical protein C0391_08445 [Anaerolinea sp.]|nr:hypothetical protein [Anaerolinea sp.]